MSNEDLGIKEIWVMDEEEGEGKGVMEGFWSVMFQ